MNTRILMIFAALLIFACQASANSVGINSISIIPSQPSNTDLITFNISGWAAKTSSWVDHDVFSQNGTSLQLDLYVDMGFGDVFSYWYGSKQIQPLVPGTYSLEVRAFRYWSNTLEDTESVNFTVTPEPCTLVLLGLGLPFLRGFSKRKA